MRIVPMALTAAVALTLTATLASAQAAPGTVVTNSIDLSYSSGGSTISAPAAASVAFTVDRKIDLLTGGVNAGKLVTAEQGANDPVLSYLVQNLGNGTQGFDIDVVATGTLGLTYATTAGGEGTYWVAIGTSATPAPGTDVLYDVTGILNAGDRPANGAYYVHVYVNIANSATSGQEKDFAVTARALNAGTNVVTAELRGQGINAVDTIYADPLPTRDGAVADSQKLKVNAPVLTASKTVAVISENLDENFICASGAQVAGAVAPIPGACLEYTISITNGAAATQAARNLEIKDLLPAGVTYSAHTVGGFSTVTQAGQLVTGNLINLAVGATASFTIRAVVN